MSMMVGSGDYVSSRAIDTWPQGASPSCVLAFLIAACHHPPADGADTPQLGCAQSIAMLSSVATMLTAMTKAVMRLAAAPLGAVVLPVLLSVLTLVLTDVFVWGVAVVVVFITGTVVVTGEVPMHWKVVLLVGGYVVLFVAQSRTLIMMCWPALHKVEFESMI